jgi:hypothetical protein
MYEYIGILLGSRPILHISRIKVKYPSPWRSVLLEKVTDSKLDRNSPHFMELEVSLAYSQSPPPVPVLNHCSK